MSALVVHLYEGPFRCVCGTPPPMSTHYDPAKVTCQQCLDAAALLGWSAENQGADGEALAAALKQAQGGPS